MKRVAASTCHPTKRPTIHLNTEFVGVQPVPQCIGQPQFMHNLRLREPTPARWAHNTSPRSGTRQEFRGSASPLRHLGHGLWLGGPLCVMFLAATMSVGPGRTVSLPWIGAFPETCTLHTQLGIDCPGCGLTRSFIHLAHGRIQAAWSLNPIAPFMFAYLAWQIPLALVSLWAVITTGNATRPNFTTNTSEQERSVRLSGRLSHWAQYNQWLLVGLMLALLLRWSLLLVTGGLI